MKAGVLAAVGKARRFTPDLEGGPRRRMFFVYAVIDWSKLTTLVTMLRGVHTVHSFPPPSNVLIEPTARKRFKISTSWENGA